MNDWLKLGLQVLALFVGITTSAVATSWFLASSMVETRSQITALSTRINAWHTSRANLPDRIAWLEGNVAGRLATIESDIKSIRDLLDRRASMRERQQ